MTINATTKARFALFTRVPKDTDEAGKTYPLMFGSIENKDFKVQVAAFLKTNTNTQAKFLSLQIRNEHDEQTFTGTLHRSTKPGKEDTYYGYINEQFVDEVDGADVYTTSEWQLIINAKQMESGGGVKYIGGDIYPSKKNAEAAAPAVTADIPF